MPEDAKKNSKIEFLEEATKFGSLIYLIREGWLRKRWRERFCVLKDDIIYLFENKIKDNSDKPVSTIHLNKYEEAKAADKKDCKKGLTTFLIQPKKSENKKCDVKRALFAASDPELVEDWKNQINKTIKKEKTVGPTLKHLTKTRPKLQNEARGRSRRPPSRAHLRNKALTSSVGLLLDQSIEEEATTTVEKKRGKVPTTALKPKKPKIDKNEEKKETQGDAEKDPQNTSKGETETPSSGEKIAEEEVTKKEEKVAKKPPPPLPDSSKKPKLEKKKSEDREEDVEVDEKCDLRSEEELVESDKKESDEEGGAFTDDELDEVEEDVAEGNLNNCNRVSLEEDQLKDVQKEDKDQLDKDEDQVDKDKDQLDKDKDHLDKDQDHLENKKKSSNEISDEESNKDLLKKKEDEKEDQKCIDEDLEASRNDSLHEDQLEESYNDLPNDVQDALNLLEASAEMSSSSSNRSTEDEDDKDLKKLATDEEHQVTS